MKENKSKYIIEIKKLVMKFKMQKYLLTNMNLHYSFKLLF